MQTASEIVVIFNHLGFTSELLHTVLGEYSGTVLFKRNDSDSDPIILKEDTNGEHLFGFPSPLGTIWLTGIISTPSDGICVFNQSTISINLLIPPTISK